MFNVGDRVRVVTHEGTLQGRVGTIKSAYTGNSKGERWVVAIEGREEYVLYEYRLAKLEGGLSPVIEKIRWMAERQIWKKSLA